MSNALFTEVGGEASIILINDEVLCVDRRRGRVTDVALVPREVWDVLTHLARVALSNVGAYCESVLRELKDVEQHIMMCEDYLSGGVFDTVYDAVTDTLRELRELSELMAKREELLRKLSALREAEAALRKLIDVHGKMRG